MSSDFCSLFFSAVLSLSLTHSLPLSFSSRKRKNSTTGSGSEGRGGHHGPARRQRAAAARQGGRRVEAARGARGQRLPIFFGSSRGRCGRRKRGGACCGDGALSGLRERERSSGARVIGGGGEGTRRRGFVESIKSERWRRHDSLLSLFASFFLRPRSRSRALSL